MQPSAAVDPDPDALAVEQSGVVLRECLKIGDLKDLVDVRRHGGSGLHARQLNHTIGRRASQGQRSVEWIKIRVIGIVAVRKAILDEVDRCRRRG